MRLLPVLACWHALAAAAPAQAPPQAAFHAPYGTGCHEAARESYYAFCSDAAVAAIALTGRSLTLTPNGDGFAASWNGGGFRAPSAAAVALPPSDDGQVAVSLAQPFPVPGGAVATLWVHSNGIVATGPGIDGGSWNTPPNDFTPSPSFRNAPDTAFFAWHDWNPAEPGSGRIVVEHVAIAGEPVLCVTWHDVENFPARVLNRGTFQFQFGLGTGRVTYVWVAVDAMSTSPFGTAHLVGYSPGGPSLDPGALPVGAAWTSMPDFRALSLAASPPPVSTAAAGTTVRYDFDNVPEAVALSTVRLGYLLLSFTPAPGIDLAFLGAPGCAAYVAAIDLSFVIGGTSAALSLDLHFPAGLPPGLDVFAQAIALLPPQQLGADHNSLGLITSNGVHSHVGDH